MKRGTVRSNRLPVLSICEGARETQQDAGLISHDVAVVILEGKPHLVTKNFLLSISADTHIFGIVPELMLMRNDFCGLAVALATLVIIDAARAASPANVDWPAYLGDKARNLYSSLDQIN